jgi:hypothetical protein
MHRLAAAVARPTRIIIMAYEIVEVTAANVHAAALSYVVLSPEPGKVYGDSTFAGRSSEQLIIAGGGVPLTVQTGTWGGQSPLERLACTEDLLDPAAHVADLCIMRLGSAATGCVGGGGLDWPSRVADPGEP